MADVTYDATCPHCGMTTTARTLARHIPLCLSRPDVRARVLEALADPADITRGVSKNRYEARHRALGAPGPRTLLQNFGGTWPQVCAEFGLQTPVRFQEEHPYREPVKREHSGYRLIPCPHCGEKFGSNKLPAHVRTCIDAPDIREAVAAALESSTPGVGIFADEYRAISSELGIPSRSTIMMRYGTWSEVLAAFGLRSPRPDTPRTYSDKCSARVTLAQREAAAIAAVDKMTEEARHNIAINYEVEHTFNGYRVRDLPGVYVNGKPCVAVMLR